jgi:alkyl sulfatase BDS1-like metallo-beta-lactamase superfamily hydrolase
VHGVLNHRPVQDNKSSNRTSVPFDAHLSFDDVTSLLVIMLMPEVIGDFIDAGQIMFEGDRSKFEEFLGYLEKFDQAFKIVEP